MLTQVHLSFKPKSGKGVKASFMPVQVKKTQFGLQNKVKIKYVIQRRCTCFANI